ncbi:MAG: DUF4303 domain-containing protein [Gemmataceae bacterium]
MSDKIAQARQLLKDGVREAFKKFRAEHADETIYAFALYNDDDGVALDASANTEEAYRQRVERDGEEDPMARWGSAEWAYEGGYLLPDIYPILSSGDEEEDEDYDKTRGSVFAVMVLALADLDQEGLFGTGVERKQITLLCTLSDSEHTGWLEKESAKRLNPPENVKKMREFLIEEEELREAREELGTYKVFLKVMKKHAAVPKPAGPSETSAAQPVAVPAGTRRFEYTDEKSNKFWEISMVGTDVTVRFGRIGTNGQTQTKSFADVAKAEKHAAKLIEEKTGKGYQEVTGD